MRFIVGWLLGGLLVAGCAGPKGRSSQSNIRSAADASPGAKQSKIIITPDTSPVGRVVRVNGDARFAVLDFPIGTVPAVGQSLSAYRQGLKVGEIRITGPQQDENTVADITHGDVQTGDEVRGSN